MLNKGFFLVLFFHVAAYIFYSKHCRKLNKLYLYLYDEKNKKIYKKDISTHVHTQTYFTAADLFIFILVIFFVCVIFLRLTTLDYANMYV